MCGRFGCAGAPVETGVADSAGGVAFRDFVGDGEVGRAEGTAVAVFAVFFVVGAEGAAGCAPTVWRAGGGSRCGGRTRCAPTEGVADSAGLRVRFAGTGVSDDRAVADSADFRARFDGAATLVGESVADSAATGDFARVGFLAPDAGTVAVFAGVRDFTTECTEELEGRIVAASAALRDFLGAPDEVEDTAVADSADFGALDRRVVDAAGTEASIGTASVFEGVFATLPRGERGTVSFGTEAAADSAAFAALAAWVDLTVVADSAVLFMVDAAGCTPTVSPRGVTDAFIVAVLAGFSTCTAFVAATRERLSVVAVLANLAAFDVERGARS